MTILSKLALICVANGEQFYSDLAHVDESASSAFANWNERDFCDGNWSTPCEEESQSICATDNWTYAGVCDFKRNYCLGNISLRFYHWGKCGTTFDYETEPLFENDWVEPSTAQVVEEEEEEEVSCMKPCSREYRPICGADGNIYANPCEFSIAQCQLGVEKAYDGECRNSNCSSACSREYSPMCGSDGETYRLGTIQKYIYRPNTLLISCKY